MNEFEDIDRELAATFAERPSVLSRPSLRDVKRRARRHQRQRSASVLGACAIVGVGGAAVLATRSPANQTTVGAGDELEPTASTICFPTATTIELLGVDDSVPPYTVPMTTVLYDGEVFFYTVQEGDNPTAVASSFGVTLAEMDAANVNTVDYGLFQVGLQLAIPVTTYSTTTTNPLIGGTYTIEAGDYPASVAEMFQVTVAELEAANRDVPGYGPFVVGAVINIPFPSQAPTTTMPADVSSEGILTFYVVQEGDSPLAVANAFGVTVDELDAANLNTPGYDAPWLVGTAIRIPLPVGSTTTELASTTTALTGPQDLNCLPVAASTLPGDTTLTTMDLSTTTVPYTRTGRFIQVGNCSNQEGAARYLSDQLAELDFGTTEPDTCTIDLPVTKIIYDPDDPVSLLVANNLALLLANAVVEPSGPAVPLARTGTWARNGGVIVLLGDDLAGKTLAQIAQIAPSGTSTTLPLDTAATVTTCIIPPQMTLPPPATTTSMPGSC